MQDYTLMTNSLARKLPDGWIRSKRHEEKTRGNKLYVFINKRSIDTKVVINKLEHTNKINVFVNESGEWNTNKSTLDTFSSQSDDTTETEHQAIKTALEWMESHPCERTESRQPVELLTDLITKLREKGIPEQVDADTAGLIATGRKDHTTHNIQFYSSKDNKLTKPDSPADADVMEIRIQIDGKESGLTYREYTETQGNSETIRLHEPTNKRSLNPTIKEAAKEIGLEKVAIEDGGHQKHWDYSVGYRIRAEITEETNINIPEVPVQNRIY